jgi:hypothetical protein
LEEGEYLSALQALAEDRGSCRIDTVNLKPVLGEIQPDRGNLHLDSSLEWRSTIAGTLQHALSGAGAVHPINARLRDELLNGEVFNSLAEARVLIEA